MYQGAQALIGKQFQQYGVLYTTIDDHHTSDTGIHGIQRALHLGQHSAVQRSFFNQRGDILWRKSGQQFARLVEYAWCIGQQQQSRGNAAGDQVGVDVVTGAIGIGTNRCNDGNDVIVHQPVQHAGTNIPDLTHEAERDVRLAGYRVRLRRFLVKGDYPAGFVDGLPPTIDYFRSLSDG